MTKGIFDPTIGALNTSLNLRSLNQGIISSNIANAETPGYQAQEVDFESTLRDTLGVGSELRLEGDNAEHIYPRETEAVDPEIINSDNDVVSLDGNTVDRAEQQAKMAENQILYDASVEMMKKKLGLLKYSMGDAGGGN